MNVRDLMAEFERTKTLKPSLYKAECLSELLMEAYGLDQDNDWKVTTTKMIADELNKLICFLNEAKDR